MSDGSASEKPPNLRLPETARYDVGYGKPPAHSRFQKGASGNSRGRPRGRRRPTVHQEIERLKSIIKAEAYRNIRMPEGEGVVSMTMAEAVMRSIAVNAAKGQSRAQRLFTELLRVTEQSEATLYNQYLETMIEYKNSWERELAHRAALGVSGPEPLPHPDDIFVDMHTGRAWVRGPMTPEDKAIWDRGLAYRDELQQDFNREIELSSKRKSRKFWRGQALFTEHLYNRFNNGLPPRYQKPLQGRIFPTQEEREELEETLRKIRLKK